MHTYKLAIGSDHAGFDLKTFLTEKLSSDGHQLVDYGTFSKDSCDYPDFIHPVACAVEHRKCDFGIIICGSGNGAAITANKHKGIRAALCWNNELSALARQHNDANILALPARYISFEQAESILNAFLSEDFEGDRHNRRIEKIEHTDCSD